MQTSSPVNARGLPSVGERPGSSAHPAAKRWKNPERSEPARRWWCCHCFPRCSHQDDQRTRAQGEMGRVRSSSSRL
jgi:hypothetical protein